MARTRDEHERVIDLVEDKMLLGFKRPNQIMKLVNADLVEAHQAHLAIGDKRTVQKMIDAVYSRWQKRGGDSEAARRELLEQAEEGVRQSYTLLAKARQEHNVNGAVGALRSVERFQQRRARLLGLDKVVLDVGLTPEAIDELRDKRFAEALAGVAPDPIRELYGLPAHPGQSDRPDHPVQPAPRAKEALASES
jgi:hypothetical protein